VELVGDVLALFAADDLHQVTQQDSQNNTGQDGHNRVFIDEGNLVDDCHANNGQDNNASFCNLSGGVLHDDSFSQFVPGVSLYE
jgi:hypothetical protein